jgi:hypothetical protein
MGIQREAGRDDTGVSPIKRRLTEKDAAEVLNVSPRTLQQWRVKGGGPPFQKLGATAVRYDPDALAAWLSAQTRTSTSKPGPAV